MVYTAAKDLCIVTTYYNPCGYQTRKRNFERFIAPIVASGMALVIVENAVGDEPFTLGEFPGVVQVRSKDVFWQKEALLNIALEHVPGHCSKVAWLDCDILFENENWAVETSNALDRYAVLQPWDEVIRLSESGEDMDS